MITVNPPAASGAAWLPTLLLLAIGPGLAGCGGGDGPRFAPGDTSAPLALTLANALAVSGEVERATEAASTIAAGLVPELEAGVIADLVASGSSGAVAAFTTGCGFAGTATLSATLAGGFQYAPGDRFVVTFAGCQSTPAAPLLNGQADITVASFAGSIATLDYTLVVDVAGTQFSAAPAGFGTITAAATGTWRQGYSSDFNGVLPVRLVQTITSPALDLVAGGAQFTWTSLSLESAREFAAGVPTTVTLSSAGTVDSERLGGSVAVTTPVLLSAPADNDPGTSFSIGRRLVTGAGNTAIRLVPQNAVEVRLDVDVTGDGITDGFIDTTWTQIRAAAP
jgi:hypothetical protein